jgi:hypothetical protein
MRQLSCLRHPTASHVLVDDPIGGKTCSPEARCSQAHLDTIPIQVYGGQQAVLLPKAFTVFKSLAGGTL